MVKEHFGRMTQQLVLITVLTVGLTTMEERLVAAVVEGITILLERQQLLIQNLLAPMEGLVDRPVRI
jgi:hypothetical protein